MNGTVAQSGSREQPWVTWLLSVRNGLPYLSKTLESIAGQTYKKHKLLVWDDASTDGTAEELRRWIPARIPGAIFTGQRLRLGLNLAFLVEQADTELCARIDGDDVNLPHRLARQVEFMQEHPEVGVVGSTTRLIDGTGQLGDHWNYPSNDAEIRWSSCWQAKFCHPSVMFRRSVVLRAGNYRNAPMMEDLDLWMRMIRVTEMHNLDEVLLHYRRTNTSMTGKLQDFFPTDREAAVLNLPQLFPNVRKRPRALRFWDASHPGRLDQTSRGSTGIFSIRNPAEQIRNIGALKRAAVLFANEVGKPADYFTNTKTFQEQRFHMRRELLEYCGFGPLLSLRSQFASAKGAATRTVLAPK